MARMRCVKGSIGLDGVIYSVGQVFDVDDVEVSISLIRGGWVEVGDTEPVVDEVVEDVDVADVDVADVDVAEASEHATHFGDDEVVEVAEDVQKPKPKRGRPAKK